ncbi:VPS4-associated protein 1 [Schizophyllum amplum]|uniref:VPS4-associated protein 1 n=1 Tax=Schizophyllum amplum TaxID=97359 RepID=A0A550CUE5_9AGAR|nr:VPS4-associated protein 1 [Auriculariopsis ampla]
MSFDNVYYKRTTATAKACFVCYKPTTTVLATINTTDFLYTCPGHLTDPSFATQVQGTPGTARSAVSAEEIARVKAEYEDKQKRRQEKDPKAKEDKPAAGDTGSFFGLFKGAGAGAENKEKEKEKAEEPKASSPAPPGSMPSSPSPAPATPTHQRYALHRDFFAMRQAEHRKRRQAAQAKELAPRLPHAPWGATS